MAAQPRKRSRRTLGREDWLTAALEAVIEEGPSGFRVARIARRLQVTSASFYWHFQDRDELRDRVLKHWLYMLRNAAAAGSRADPSNTRGLLTVLERRGLPRADAAMRRWAAEDPVVANAVEKADVLRHSVVVQAFEAEGLDKARAKKCADLLGWAFRGSSGVGDARRASALRELVDALLRDVNTARGETRLRSGSKKRKRK